MERGGLVTKKNAVYEPFGDELSPEVAFLQAAASLDVAAQLAVQSHDTEKLMDISAMWLGLAKTLRDGFPEENEELSEKEKNAFGFSNSSKIDEPIKEVVTEDA